MNTIVGKSYVNVRDEKKADAAITPGMLVRRTPTGVAVHNVEKGPVNPLFALEDDLQGRDIDDAYASGDIVQLWKPTPGDQVYAIADDTASGAIAIGDFLESNGNGRLRKATTLTLDTDEEFGHSLVGVALEAVTPGPTSPRFLIEIL